MNGNRNDDDDDRTPSDRPPQVANPMYMGIVRALHNHALVLAQSRRSVLAVRDRYAAEAGPTIGPEMADLARQFRKESDSAADVARQAEAIAQKDRA